MPVSKPKKLTKAERQAMLPVLEENKECPYCKIGLIVKRHGKWGDFLGCTSFPRCAATKHLETDDIGARNYKEEKSNFEIINGRLVERK